MTLDGDRDGVTYNPTFDYARLNRQMRRVYDLVCDGNWYTLNEISYKTGDPEASISARLRDLRKAKFGGWTVDRRRRVAEKGLHEYRLQGPELNKGQLVLI